MIGHWAQQILLVHHKRDSPPFDLLHHFVGNACIIIVTVLASNRYEDTVAPIVCGAFVKLFSDNPQTRQEMCGGEKWYLYSVVACQ